MCLRMTSLETSMEEGCMVDYVPEIRVLLGQQVDRAVCKVMERMGKMLYD